MLQPVLTTAAVFCPGWRGTELLTHCLLFLPAGPVDHGSLTHPLWDEEKRCCLDFRKMLLMVEQVNWTTQKSRQLLTQPHDPIS